uniref:Uncharacterized protein n=1 Tax=Compsopogon caeruleus TaxID=31354 RepID=A0A7S1THP7_9RHOD|mmetsp:Transcript_6653/g.13511  ORF Transcript_6653/g.13511 Transcript_6653/m.13511 type:complete len:159 (+) Transcript_6653:41-517(+)|eukprot:CAMPEP_0184682018 /NCGR_PEP_ID=MMETSP0312-20130426/5382_1 /TAXON_ID=31354 /ORGANISM="Compsopogon coeruleus, Strain SAG 36.94" /LENGTH=158 /DNA_ID=CAMNT_0027133261 /DNA_START=32 /DNA_END=508 /DNA_ORIENTATION=-
MIGFVGDCGCLSGWKDRVGVHLSRQRKVYGVMRGMRTRLSMVAQSGMEDDDRVTTEGEGSVEVPLKRPVSYRPAEKAEGQMKEDTLYDDGDPVGKREGTRKNKKVTKAAAAQGSLGFADAWAASGRNRFDVWFFIGLATLLAPIGILAWGIATGRIPI